MKLKQFYVFLNSISFISKLIKVVTKRILSKKNAVIFQLKIIKNYKHQQFIKNHAAVKCCIIEKTGSMLQLEVMNKCHLMKYTLHTKQTIKLYTTILINKIIIRYSMVVKEATLIQ